MTPDLDIVIVSHGDGAWLPACLRSLEERSGGCAYRVIVVENGPGETPVVDGAEVIRTPNDGFAAANNVGYSLSTAERILFLNPDTELREGTLAGLCQALDARPDVGLLAVRQLNPAGGADPSLRRFPSPGRALAQALWSERWPFLRRRVGERVLDPEAYEREGDWDWTTGAVMLVRRAAIEAAGPFDDWFFLYSEETDLCRRIKSAGWRIVHDPSVGFLHHAGKAGVDVRRESQMIYARLQYAEKHFGPLRRLSYRAALVIGHALRAALLSMRGATSSSSAEASRACLKVLLGRSGSPFGRPPGRPSVSSGA